MAKKTIDEAVLDLLRKVDQKKAEIKAASKRPVWKTNCTIGFDQSSAAGRVNIMTRDLPTVLDIYAFLLLREQAAKQAAQELGVEPVLSYMGYPFAEWKEDLKTRAAQLSIDQKKKELDALDARVNRLVSPDQRREMELQALQSILGDDD